MISCDPVGVRLHPTRCTVIMLELMWIPSMPPRSNSRRASSSGASIVVDGPTAKIPLWRHAGQRTVDLETDHAVADSMASR